MKKREGSSHKRAKLIEEASSTLNKYGVSHTSLAEIAKRLKVSREALYYYVNDKEDLIFQCYQESCRLLSENLECAQTEHSGSLEIINGFLGKLLSEDQPEFAALSEPHCLHDEQRNAILESCTLLKNRIAKIIDDGISTGDIRPCHSSVVALAILGSVFWIPTAHRWASSAGLSQQDFVIATREILSLGIAKDRGKPIDYETASADVAAMPVTQVFNPGTLAAARKDAILAAASWLFNLKGFGATSVDEIADRIGVTKKVIYHNVGNKEKLLIECFRRSFEFYEEALHKLTPLRDQPLRFICSATSYYVAAGMREELAPLVSVAGMDALPEDVLADINASGVRMMEAYLAAFQRGQDQKEIRDLNARAVISSQPAFSQWIPKWQELLHKEERDAVPREIAELMRVGLLPISG